MAKKNALDMNILKALRGSSRTLKVHEIATLIGLNPKSKADEKSIQRALKRLIEAEPVVAIGGGRSRVYGFKVSPNVSPNLSVDVEVSTDLKKTIELFGDMPLSPRSIDLISYLSAPHDKRPKVSYNEELLKNYRPNEIFYLSADQRDQLHKVGHVTSGELMAGTFAKDIYGRLTLDLSWNSSRLEGNTYSLIDTQRLFERGEIPEGKNDEESQMILNHKAAIEFLVESAAEIDFNKMTICNLHALLSDNLLGNQESYGSLRKKAVGIRMSSYEPIDNPYLLSEYFDLFLEKAKVIKDPFEQCFFALIHLPYLEAFDDVNKRTSRLAANIPLIKGNWKPMSFIDVNQSAYAKALLGFYEKNDTSLFVDLFMWAYERSARSYNGTQQAMGAQNHFKLKYRQAIHDIVRKIVVSQVPGKQITIVISRSVEDLALSDEESKKLFEILEQEILNLHSGNFARYRIKQSEFDAWSGLR